MIFTTEIEKPEEQERGSGLKPQGWPMDYRLADYLRVINPYFPPELVSEASLLQLDRLANVLQPSWGSWLECGLGAGIQPASFAVHLPDKAAQIDSQLLSVQEWQCIQKLCLAREQGISALGQGIESIWLSFDLDRQQSDIPIPNGVFLGAIESDELDLGELHFGVERAANCCWLAQKAIEQIYDREIPGAVQENLFASLQALPTGAQVLYLGLMIGSQQQLRPQQLGLQQVKSQQVGSEEIKLQKIRIDISGIPARDISQYSNNRGWLGSAVEWEAIAEQLEGLVDRVVLNIEFGSDNLGKVSLECYLDRRLDDSAQWQPLLNYLVETQLCTPEKCKALLSWPGLCYESSTQEAWPPNLTLISKFLGGRASSVMAREILYIRLAWESETPVEAKAGLWFGPDWI